MNSSHIQNKETIREIDKIETNLLEQDGIEPASSDGIKPSSFHVYLKYISLIMFTLNHVIRSSLLRYARTISAPRFFKSTFIFICEIQKVIFSIIIFFAEERNIINGLKRILRTILTEPYATMKLCIVALVYTLQNYRSLVVVEKLDIATYTVTSQLKILTTAIFTRFLLNRHLHVIQWFSLVLLLIGISIVEYENITSKKERKNVEPIGGFIDVIIICICSGFAGVYLEKLLKNTNTSLWIYNIQLATLSIISNALVVYIVDRDNIKIHGFFYGYTKIVWISTILNSIGGLLVGLVMKYSDNILKGFASSTSVVLSCIIAMIFFNFQLTIFFSIGSLLVIFSIIIYSNPDLFLSISLFKLCFKDKHNFV